MATIKLNKIEAARRQIDVAIRLLFANEDPAAIHTLAMAGFRILRDLASSRDDSYMHNLVQEMIKPGMEGKFWGAIQSFSSFLKHADVDPDAIADNIEEESNDISLLLASIYYQDLGYQLTPEMMALVAWYTAIRPEFIRADASESFHQQLALVGKSLHGKTRQEQLIKGREVLDIAKSIPRR